LRPLPARARRLALAAILCAGCASPEERFAEHVARAEAYLAERHSDEARIELLAALKIDPGSADVNWRLGELLSESGAQRAALFHFGEAYRLDPSRVDAALRQVSLLWRESPQVARRILQRVKAEHPDDPRVHRTESALALVRGDPTAALAAARAALDLDPDDPDSWAQLGSAHKGRIREARARGAEPADALYEEAIAAFDKVDELEGGHVGARLEKAHVYGSWRNHSDDAVAAYRSAIALAQQRDNRKHWLGAALAMEAYAHRTKRGKLRLQALRAAVEADPTRIRTWETLARAVEENRGLEQAERVYQRLLEQQSDRPAAHIAYTSHLARQRRGADAIEHLERILEKGLDAAILWEQLVRLELSDGLRADARATYRRMRELHADDPLTKRSAARLAVADGRGADALEILRGIKGTDDSSEVEQLRALGYLDIGNTVGASAAIQRALSLAQDFPITAKRIEASVRHEARQWYATLEVLRALEEHGQQLTAEERFMRARALYELGRHEAGRRELDALLGESAVSPQAAVEFSKREGRRHPADAQRRLSRALRQAPGSYELLAAMTRLDVEAGQADRALRRLDAVVESQLAVPRVLLLRAELLSLAGELRRAEADALKAFEADPQLPGAVDLLFAIYERQGKLAEALRAFEEAESVGVLHPGARVLLGRLYLSQGRSEDARSAYEAVIELNPENAGAKNDLAYLLAVEGRDLQRAQTLAEQAQRALPDRPEAIDTVGYVYFRRGHHEAALHQLRRAIALAETQRGEAPAIFHYHAGLTLSALERDAEAAAAFERALALDSGFSGATDARRRLEAATPRARPETSAESDRESS
jgi:tetratricopeptide (TPR) repeat protein